MSERAFFERGTALVNDAQSACRVLDAERQRNDVLRGAWWHRVSVQHLYAVVTPVTIAVEFHLQHLARQQRETLLRCLQVASEGLSNKLGIPNFYGDCVQVLEHSLPPPDQAPGDSSPSSSRPRKIAAAGAAS